MIFEASYKIWAKKVAEGAIKDAAILKAMEPRHPSARALSDWDRKRLQQRENDSRVYLERIEQAPQESRWSVLADILDEVYWERGGE